MIFIIVLTFNYKLKSLCSHEDTIIYRDKIIYKDRIIERSTYEFSISAYTLRKSECNDDLANTAIMEKPIPGYTAAISRDHLYLLNKKVYIQDVGVFKINDLMNKRFENSLDILLGNVISAKKFGRKIKKVVVIE